MLHGFATSRATWDDILPLMPKDRFTLHLLDLKGFGLSPKPRDGRYDLDSQAALVEEYIKSKALSNVVLVGHSFGGAIALATALRLKDQCKNVITKIVLIDAAIFPQRLPFFIGLMGVPVLGHLFLMLLPTRLAVVFTLRSLYWKKERVTSGKIQRYTEIFRQAGMRYVMKTMARQLVPVEPERYTSRYGGITVPILGIWGSFDRLVSLALGKRIISEFSHSELQVIENCGHNPQEEEPEQVVTHLRRFLEDTANE
jgi:pimeloyl-ACP methyl ester carboxylesterase